VCKPVIKACLFLVALTLSFMVSATGLGKLTLNSYLGQPFKAKIDLVSVKKEDISSITVSLASLDTFRLANIDYARFLRTFEFSVKNSVDGQPYVKLVSLQPVIEPSFSMLIELNWSSGSLIREYTVQLVEDIPQSVSPVMQQDEPVIPISVKPEPTAAEQPDHSRTVENLAGDEESTVKETMLEPEVVPAPEPAPEQEQEQERVSAEKSVATTYGPVKSGDTLTKIVQERIFYKIQLNQILVALLRANREAFIDNNMNRLKTGYMLQIPDESEVATISPDVADKEIKMQMTNWEAYRQRLVIEAAIPSTSEEPEQTATGEITTILDDNSSTETARESSEGLLRLSKGMEVVEGAEEGSGEETISIQEKFNIVEDNSIAGEKALNEANERISLLERAIK
jgi:pilus assembly protein FimV